jgi:hypothetical protein
MFCTFFILSLDGRKEGARFVPLILTFSRKRKKELSDQLHLTTHFVVATSVGAR